MPSLFPFLGKWRSYSHLTGNVGPKSALHGDSGPSRVQCMVFSRVRMIPIIAQVLEALPLIAVKAKVILRGVTKLSSLLCKAERQYLLTCKVSRYCLLVLHGSCRAKPIGTICLRFKWTCTIFWLCWGARHPLAIQPLVRSGLFFYHDNNYYHSSGPTNLVFMIFKFQHYNYYYLCKINYVSTFSMSSVIEWLGRELLWRGCGFDIVNTVLRWLFALSGCSHGLLSRAGDVRGGGGGEKCVMQRSLGE